MSGKKIQFREIANRVTGFGVLGVSASWTPSVLDIEVAKGLLTYLEDRRVLYKPYSCEEARYVVESILEIRKRLTSDLERLDRASPLSQSLIAMRAACRQFLDEIRQIDVETIDFFGGRWFDRTWNRDEKDFFMALGGLRSIIGVHLAQIVVRYGIDVEETLVSIFPASSENDDS